MPTPKARPPKVASAISRVTARVQPRGIRYLKNSLLDNCFIGMPEHNHVQQSSFSADMLTFLDCEFKDQTPFKNQLCLGEAQNYLVMSPTDTIGSTLTVIFSSFKWRMSYRGMGTQRAIEIFQIGKNIGQKCFIFKVCKTYYLTSILSTLNNLNYSHKLSEIKEINHKSYFEGFLTRRPYIFLPCDTPPC